LHNNVAGGQGTAVGSKALEASTAGNTITALGFNSLGANMTAINNTAAGYNALGINTTGARNTALGTTTLALNNGNDNTALGYQALSTKTTGNNNIALGSGAGSAVTTGSNNITIGSPGSATSSRIDIGVHGTQTTCFIQGIDVATVSGTPVLVTATGQLGVAASSRNYKQDIEPMADTSSALLEVMPVTFTYKPEYGDAEIHYGFVGEELYEKYPSLVGLDYNGNPAHIHYHELPAMLLNELQKTSRSLDVLEEQVKYVMNVISSQYTN
jgi:hypothetical protein